MKRKTESPSEWHNTLEERKKAVKEFLEASDNLAGRVKAAIEEEMEKKTFCDMCLDPVFKKCFTVPENLKILVEAVLGVKVSNLRILPEEISHMPGEKGSECDVRCMVDLPDGEGTTQSVIIEMQNKWSSEIMPRLVYYSYRSSTEKIRKGVSYTQYIPVITICITREIPGEYEEMKKDDWSRDLVDDIRMRVPSGKSVFNGTVIKIVKLPLIMEKAPDELESPLEKLMYILANISNFAMIPENLREYEPIIDSARLSKFSTKEELIEYMENYAMYSREEELIKYNRMEAKKEKAVEDAIEFYKNGVSEDIIAKSLKISSEKLDTILKDAGLKPSDEVSES